MEKKNLMDLLSSSIETTYDVLKGRYQIEDMQRPEWLEEDIFNHIKNCLYAMMDYERNNPVYSK